MAAREAFARFALVSVALGFVACMPTTDRDRYQIGEPGTVTLPNQLPTTVYLAGCSHFEYEKRVGAQWQPQGSDIVCVWEGLAQPVPPGTEVVDDIRGRSIGTWRVRYPVGVGCREDAPLSAESCDRVVSVVSNEFEVVATDCIVTGCSSQVCAPAPVATTCEWRPEYACYRDAVCGHFGPADECAWLQTEELGRCLASDGGNLTPR